ncbi:MAG TPA: L,D-transpeptidase family protein [Solirubrobacteraceae bacterium]|jgi:lipoprotein-anchoring transpeptidase ErfK/SrfK|nr:L,D-transpeptidase family protein [Solirubrobacteraceae bacterium]
MRTPRLLVLCCIAATALLGAVPAGATPPLPGEVIAAGVTAAGLDVSGLTPDAAAAKLDGAFGDELRAATVTVQAADTTWTLKAIDADVLLDATQSAKRALYAGRDAAGKPVDVPLAVTYTRSAINNFIAPIAKRLHRDGRDAKLKITIKRVRVTHSQAGRELDESDLKRQIDVALGDPRAAHVLRPKVRVTKAKVTADKLRAKTSTVITVDQKTFTLRLFKRLKVVKTYKVAVGQPQYPTPRGLFSVTNKQVNPVWSVPNSPWAGELAGTTVDGGSAANPLKARWMGLVDGVGIHGTGEDASIGSRASHGCVRMHVGDVIALYKRVPLGTPVLIG